MPVAETFTRNTESPTMIERLRDCFARTLHREMPAFSPELSFAELPGWDSVAHLSLLLAVEQTFTVAFTSRQMVEMKTIGDMLEVLRG